MAERIFLENVESSYSINVFGNAKAWEVRHFRNDPTVPPLIYVMESEVGQRLLLGREISGRPKFNMIRYLAKLFIELFFGKLNGKDVCSYTLQDRQGISSYLFHQGIYPVFDFLW